MRAPPTAPSTSVPAPTPAPQEPSASTTGALVLNLAHRQLTSQELNAARNCVSVSQHTKLSCSPTTPSTRKASSRASCSSAVPTTPRACCR